MMAPAVAKAMAGLITKGITKGSTRVSLDMKWYDPYRFERSGLRSSAF